MGAGLVACLMLAPRETRAAPVVSVLHFAGRGEAEIQRVVTSVVSAHGFRPLPQGEVLRTAARLHVSAVGPDEIRAVAAQLGLSAVVTGRLVGNRWERTAWIRVHDVRTGTVAAQAEWSARTLEGLSRAVARGFWPRLGPALSRCAAHPPAVHPGEAAETSTLRGPAPRPRQMVDEEPPHRRDAPSPPGVSPATRSTASPVVGSGADADGPPAVVESAVAPAGADPPLASLLPDEAAAGPTTVELSIGPRMVYRHLSYDTDPDNALTPFRTRQPAPALGLAGAWFLRLVNPRLGLAGALEYGAPLDGRSADLTYRLPSSDYSASVLVGYAAPLGTVDLAVGAGRHLSGVVPEGAAVSRPRLIPDVDYQYVRTGLAVHVYIDTRLAVIAGAFYRHVLSAGAIASGDWFPSLRVHGGEATVGLSYRFLPALEARLHGEVRLYRFAIDPTAAGGHVTTGALDQYWSAWLAIAVVLGGQGERR
jgi:hypothetical protein